MGRGERPRGKRVAAWRRARRRLLLLPPSAQRAGGGREGGALALLLKRRAPPPQPSPPGRGWGNHAVSPLLHTGLASVTLCPRPARRPGLASRRSPRLRTLSG